MTVRAEVIDQHDDPHVLAHWPQGATEDDIKRAAQAAWEADVPGYDEPAGEQPTGWRMDPCRLYRWVPGGEYGEYTRELHWARKAGPGAFWAVECWPVYARELQEAER